MTRWRATVTEELKQLWEAKATLAPYRASVGEDIDWKTSWPHWDLAVVMKSSRRGHRLLMAFEFAELRDYFVAAHHDQDAQIEPDFADEAGPRRRVSPAALTQDLDRAIADAKRASADEKRAMEQIDFLFNAQVSRLLANHQVEDALSLTRSIPARCTSKTLALSDIHKSGLWDRDKIPFDRVNPAPYDQPRAAALAAWQVSANRAEAAISRLDDLMKPIVDDAVAQNDFTTIERLANQHPDRISRAFILDRLRQAKLHPQAAEDHSVPGPS